MVDVSFAGIHDVQRHSSSITSKTRRKTLVFLPKDTREVGSESKQSSINASLSALTAIESFMPELQLSRVIGIETSGEFREACVARSLSLMGRFEPYGNPERSSAKRTFVAENVQRLGDEELYR